VKGLFLLVKKCAVKGAGLQRVQVPPLNWFAPPGRMITVAGAPFHSPSEFRAESDDGDSFSVLYFQYVVSGLISREFAHGLHRELADSLSVASD
jgi:hypothetical protein